VAGPHPGCTRQQSYLHRQGLAPRRHVVGASKRQSHARTHVRTRMRTRTHAHKPTHMLAHLFGAGIALGDAIQRAQQHVQVRRHCSRAKAAHHRRDEPQRRQPLQLPPKRPSQPLRTPIGKSEKESGHFVCFQITWHSCCGTGNHLRFTPSTQTPKALWNHPHQHSTPAPSCKHPRGRGIRSSNCAVQCQSLEP
jgi:hypothetical protein